MYFIDNQLVSPSILLTEKCEINAFLSIEMRKMGNRNSITDIQQSIHESNNGQKGS